MNIFRIHFVWLEANFVWWKENEKNIETNIGKMEREKDRQTLDKFMYYGEKKTQTAPHI